MAQIKYNNKREYLDFYGTALAARYGRTIRRMQADALVPVPVHATRKNDPGHSIRQRSWHGSSERSWGFR